MYTTWPILAIREWMSEMRPWSELHSLTPILTQFPICHIRSIGFKTEELNRPCVESLES